MPDWSAIGKKAKSKGTRGERRVAQLLNELTGKGFRKTPSSGGYNKFGGVVIAEHKFCGDVICDDQSFAFCVEAKNRPDDFSAATLSTAPQSAQFSDWWSQVNEESKKVKLLPMLYFKFGKASNNLVKNDFIAITERVAEYLEYPMNKPHLKVVAYDQPVWIKLKVKIKGKRTKQNAMMLVKLPDPLLINWNNLADSINKDKLFSLPDWVEEENNRFQIIERDGPDNAIWR
jgi:hypothetical protein